MREWPTKEGPGVIGSLSSMTVCIAALCKKRKAVLLAADRMVTAGPPMNIELEHHTSKFEVLEEGTALMFAGDALVTEEIVRSTSATLKQQSTNGVTKTVGEAVLPAYRQVRLVRVEENLKAMGYDSVQHYYEKGLQHHGEQLHGSIVQQITTLNIGSELVVAGFDDECARICHVYPPGAAKWYDRLGYHAVGSGGMHAAMSLLRGRFNPDAELEDALLQVYTAKRTAEAAPGVGRQTDVLVLRPGSQVTVDSAIFKELARLYDESQSQGQLGLEKLSELVQAAEVHDD